MVIIKKKINKIQNKQLSIDLHKKCYNGNKIITRLKTHPANIHHIITMTLCRIPKQTCAFYKKWEREILPPRGHTQGQNPFPYKCIKRDYIICAGVYIKRVLQKITFDAICDMFTCIKNIHFFFFKVSSAFKKKKKRSHTQKQRGAAEILIFHFIIQIGGGGGADQKSNWFPASPTKKKRIS